MAEGRRCEGTEGRKGEGAEGRRGGRKEGRIVCVCLGVSRFVSTVRFLFLSYIHFVHYLVKSILVNLAASRSSDPRCWSIFLKTNLQLAATEHRDANNQLTDTVGSSQSFIGSSVTCPATCPHLIISAYRRPSLNHDCGFQNSVLAIVNSRSVV